MSAGGYWYGVLLTDRGTEEFEPDADQLELHWTVGKTAALAVAARAATRQGERARALTDRIDLARDVHDGVIQRLFGVSLALSAAGDMPAEVRERCHSEVQAALAELREAIQRPLGRSAPAMRTTLRELLDDLSGQREVVLDEGADVEVPAELEPLAQSVVAEAVRNARKHAAPTRIGVRCARATARSSSRCPTTASPPGPPPTATAGWACAWPASRPCSTAASWSSGSAARASGRCG